MATYIARVSDSASCIGDCLEYRGNFARRVASLLEGEEASLAGMDFRLRKGLPPGATLDRILEAGGRDGHQPGKRSASFLRCPKPSLWGLVLSFLILTGLSRSILHLSWTLVGMISGCFYDDFPLLEIDTSAKLTTESFEHLLTAHRLEIFLRPRQVQRLRGHL